MREGIKFEVHIVEHCNLNCKGCFHFSNIAEPEFLDVDEYERDVKRLSELYGGKLALALLLGGEPLLHSEIVEFMKITRTYFPTGKIGLVTNGILLSQMSESFWITCKQYNITLMPTVYPLNIDYERIEEIAEKNNVIIDYFNDKHEVKKLSVLSIDADGKQNALENFKNCYRANFCITLKHGRLYTCLIPAHLHHYAKKYNVDISSLVGDGIDIYMATGKDEIEEFLGMPISACAYCNRKKWRDGLEWSCSEYKQEEWK